MEDYSLCRTCLSRVSLNPVFVDTKDHAKYSKAIFDVTGLKVQSQDGLPQKICSDCIKFLDQCILFKDKCQQTEKSLLRMKQQIKDKKLLETQTLVKIEILKETKTELLDEDGKPLKQFMKDCSQEKSKNFNIENENTKQECAKQMEVANVNHKIKTKLKKTIVSDSELLYEFVDAEKKRVVCKLCVKELSIRSIALHIVKHHPGADGTRVKCELCDTYVTREKMNRHTILMHGSENFRCIYCKCTHSSRSSLATHAATCDRKKKKRKPSQASLAWCSCTECGKRMRRASLAAHSRLHAGARPVCEHCGLRFGSARRLAEHGRARHAERHAPLRCDSCDFRCASRLALQNHERRHSGERPFVCEHCGARFTARAALARHRHGHGTDRGRVKKK